MKLCGCGGKMYRHWLYKRKRPPLGSTVRLICQICGLSEYLWFDTRGRRIPRPARGYAD